MGLTKRGPNNTQINKKKDWSARNKKISKALMGNTNAKGHVVPEKARKQISEKASKTIRKKIEEEGFHWGMTGKKQSVESNRKNRIKRIAYLEKTKLNGKQFVPRIGKNETEILDKLEKDMGQEIKRQFYIGGYFIDGYIPDLNLAIEVDEYFHIFQEEKDRTRQEEIEGLLGCDFLRIKDDTNPLETSISPF